jgi:hypothetical protein
MLRLVVSSTVLAVVAGCGSATPAPVTPRPPAESPSPSADATTERGPFIEVEGTGEDRATARARAETALAEALLGDAAWASLTHVKPSDPEVDAKDLSASSETVTVTLGLSRERASDLLAEVPERPATEGVSAPYRAAVADVVRAGLEALVCHRRRILLDAPCDAPEPAEAVPAELRGELRTLTEPLRLRPFLEGGVPVGDEGSPLAPVELRVSYEGADEATRVAGLPFRARSHDGAELGTPVSDESGALVVPASSSDAFPVTVDLDRQALLGPLADLWPALSARIDARRTGLARWSAGITERVHGRSVGDGVFAPALEEALRARGAHPRAELSQDLRATLRETDPGRYDAALRDVARAMRGGVDVHLQVELDSEFASRMGTQRVWYEARGRIVAHNVWTGRRVAEISGAVTAPGIGEERADRAAREKLAKHLVEKLVEAPATRLAPDTPLAER